MNVLVTGANGFIGSNLCRALIERGYRVRGMVRKSSDLSYLKGFDMELVYGNLGDKKDLELALKDVDTVYHLAALSLDWGPFKSFLKTNVEGTKNMLEGAKEANIKKFVYISSVVVHGFEDRLDADENTPFKDTIFPYCKSKKMAEEIVWEYYRKYNLPITVIRPGNVFGPNDGLFFTGVAGAIDKGYMPHVNKGRAITCLTYIENLVSGMILAGESKKSIQ